MQLKWRIALPVLALLLISTILTTGLGYFITKNSVTEMMENIIDSNLNTLYNQVQRAQNTEQNISDEMDAKNLALTRSLAEIIRLNAVNGTLNPQNSDYFQRIADLMHVSEIHITDERGVLVGGNFPNYFGFDFHSGDQTIPFLRILEDPSYELAQEPQLNASYGELFQYIGASRTDRTGIVQVGLDAQVVDKFREMLDISNTAKDMQIGSTGRASIIQNGVIVYSKVAEKVGEDVTAEAWYNKVSSGQGKEWLVVDGESFYCGYANINDLTMLVLFPRSEYNSYVSPVIIVGVAGIAVALLITALIFFLVSNTLKPLVFLSGIMNRAGGTGDISLRAEDVTLLNQQAQAEDEIGQTFKGYSLLATHIAENARQFQTIASGDLTAEIKLVSNADVMGMSLKNTIDTLNNMFSEINQASNQVSTSSKQIADSAQNLAQGANEQASSVDQLSLSITEINNLARESSENATAAMEEVEKSGQLMDVCTEEMEQMLTSMRSINEKSKEILKTTKVIDDIAFQTNILALNAAVEAARAGQHGKGFAVVAEEVRNLASKSADAARETATLLEGSSQNVEEGNRIVERVSASLQSVVELSQKNAERIANVQSISAHQSEAMIQITNGIEQVADVIQQNSATAQESAAASQEMSGQSALLLEMVSRFKLKGQTNNVDLADE